MSGRQSGAHEIPYSLHLSFTPQTVTEPLLLIGLRSAEQVEWRGRTIPSWSLCCRRGDKNKKTYQTMIGFVKIMTTEKERSGQHFRCCGLGSHL